MLVYACIMLNCTPAQSPPSPEAVNTSLENLVGTQTSSIRLHCCTNILLYLHKEAVPTFFRGR